MQMNYKSFMKEKNIMIFILMYILKKQKIKYCNHHKMIRLKINEVINFMSYLVFKKKPKNEKKRIKN